jgi:hypothetical protein
MNERTGFISDHLCGGLSHFNRAFRRTYGAAPSQAGDPGRFTPMEDPAQ